MSCLFLNVEFCVPSRVVCAAFLFEVKLKVKKKATADQRTKLFRSLDLDRQGTLSPKVFRKALNKAALNISQKDADKVFNVACDWGRLRYQCLSVRKHGTLKLMTMDNKTISQKLSISEAGLKNGDHVTSYILTFDLLHS